MNDLMQTLLPLMAAAEAAVPLPVPASRVQQRDRINRVTDHLGAQGVEPGPEVASVVDHSVPVAGGVIDVRVYSSGSGEPRPLYVYLHGGSFWQGSAVSFVVDALCRERSALGFVVASVEYRLAPEHRFPGPVEDCHAALAWLVAEHARLGIDPDRVVIGGASAGGNLAAAVTLLARTRGPRLMAQLLEVPALDLTGGHLVDTGNGMALGDAAMREVRELYLAEPGQESDELASPLLAADLTGLPPALVMVAEHDELRGDGEAYARRLGEHGVKAELRCVSGHVHVSPQFTALLESARVWRGVVHEWLTRVAAG
ncbi:alpha/beta hydrolase [Lentzea sp. NPDC058436]|uniref:alpha/beta hydrolase n=1 Tax=Lentzea sp. NPDC058436 TaxID=3346499 RepID=UPI003658EEE9